MGRQPYSPQDRSGPTQVDRRDARRYSRRDEHREDETWGTSSRRQNHADPIEKRDTDNDERRLGHRRGHEDRRDFDYPAREMEEEPTSHRRERSRDRGRERESARPPRRSASPPSRSRPRSTSSTDKIKPNFTPSGLLAAATNSVETSNGTSVLLKYHEPPEARKPAVGWRLYVFKGSEQVDLLHIHRQSAYLIGRDRTVSDISVDHPSCSKQHAVIQYRTVQAKDETGASKNIVKPFILDLESTNGTRVNDDPIPVSRYFELKHTDVIKFGQSTREYVLLHDEAQ